MSPDRPISRLGTSSAVVAAFVGPGTVLTCAAAGMQFGYRLGWVLVFATAAVFVLQFFTAATGIVGQSGLGEAMRVHIGTRLGRTVVFSLVVLGLWIGCAAFEMGNLIGAATGLVSLSRQATDYRWLVAFIGATTALLLLFNARILIHIFSVLVAAMSILFLSAFAVTPIDWSALFSGLFKPTIPGDAPLTVVALVGTTVVTYNLFLHATLCKTYWRGEYRVIKAFRRELTGMALFLPAGGLISLAILGTGATLGSAGTHVSDIGAFSTLLEPVAGPAARYLFGIGLFFAGITSALTAPLAAATGIREIFGWPVDHRDRRFRLVWMSVLLFGVLFAFADYSPLAAIIAAQAANGILLPFLAGFMLYLAAKQPLLRGNSWMLAPGMLVVLLCALLGARTIWWAWTQAV